MFVRKGTVIRKNRGSGNRRSTRRSTGSGNGTRKSTIHDDPSSSGSYRLAANEEMSSAKSPSTSSLRIKQPATDMASTSAHSINHMQSESPSYQSTTFTDFKYQAKDTVKPSPARSVAETVTSFDDERQLVRTTVGWNPRTGEETQPDYGAFSYQLHEAGKESENVIEFACKTSTIICNTLLVTVLVGLSMTLPITMVSVGVKYLDDCPKEPRIPVYLLVGGCFGMIKLMSTLWRNIQARRYQDIELVFDDNDDSDGAFASTTYRTMDAILFLFLVGWQVAGTYWTLEIWKPLFKQKLHEPRNWCDQTVYMFTVYQIFGCYGVMVVYLLVLILLTCWYRCFPCRRL